MIDDPLAEALHRRTGGPVAIGAARAAILERSAAVRRRRAAATGGSMCAVVAITAIALVPDDERVGTTDGSTPTTGSSVAAMSPSPGRDTGEQRRLATEAEAELRRLAAEQNRAEQNRVASDREAQLRAADRVAALAIERRLAEEIAAERVAATASPSTSSPSTSSPSTSSPSTSSPSTSSPSTSSPSTSSPSTSSPSTSSPSTSSPSTSAAPALAPFTNTYQSAGGSIVVSWNGSSLSLGSVAPAAGFAAEVEDNEGDRVRVRFRGPDDDARIEVRVNDGRLEVRID